MTQWALIEGANRQAKPFKILKVTKHTLTKKDKIIHIVDSGSCQKYIDPNTNKHIQYREHKNIAGQAVVLPVWFVFVSAKVNVFFGKAEVDNVDDFVLFCRGEIHWFHVSNRMNDGV